MLEDDCSSRSVQVHSPPWSRHSLNRRLEPRGNGIIPNDEGDAEMTPEPTIDVEAFKNFERAGYSGVAQGYDRATAAVTSQVNQAVLDAVAAGPGTSLLDVACGPGWLSAAAVRRGAVVSALDFAENMVL